MKMEDVAIEDVRGMKISPSGNSDINYYFLIVDLPIPSDGNAPSFGGSPGYEYSEGVLTYNCDNIENESGDYSTYKMPLYLGNEPVTSIVLNWSLNGESQAQKSGDPAKLKTSTLDAPGSNSIVKEDYQFNFNVNFIRVKYLISESYPTIYFIVLFVKTYEGNSKLMNVELGETDSTMLVCNPENNTNEGETYITAAHMVRSTKDEYTSVQVTDSGTPIPINYPELV